MSRRAEAMARRLDEAAARLGIDREGRALVERAHAIAMRPRLEAGVEDHDPDFLHPARCALILMDDAGAADPTTLAVSMLVETRTPALRADARAIAALGPDVQALLAAVPDPAAGDRLVENLVAAPAPALQAALAERLDHARHLHLRPSEEWADYHALTCAAYAPVAARAHPRLAERLSWWCGMFRDRFLEVR